MSELKNGPDLEGAIEQATEAVRVQVGALTELGSAAPGGQPLGLNGLLDVPVRVTVQIGRTRMRLADLVDLGPGSLVPLDREAHEPADILVNGKIVARGEIVTLDDHYAVRITEVVSG